MFTVPFAAFGIYRFIRIVNRTDNADSPTDSMLHDPAFVVNLVLYAAAVVAIVSYSRPDMPPRRDPARHVVDRGRHAPRADRDVVGGDAARGRAVAQAPSPPAAPAAATPAQPSDLPQIAFEKYTLANGLEVILHEDHRMPEIAVDVWYKVGARDEAPGRTGFAHLFEHVMFQGTKHIPEDKHFEYLQKAGASSVNGSTSHDRTNYFEVVPANQLELALWLESERMGFLLDRAGFKETRRQPARRGQERAPPALREPPRRADLARCCSRRSTRPSTRTTTR